MKSLSCLVKCFPLMHVFLISLLSFCPRGRLFCHVLGKEKMLKFQKLSMDKKAISHFPQLLNTLLG